MFFSVLTFAALVLAFFLLVRLFFWTTSGRYTIETNLAGRVFAVTGASAGIGLETVRQLYAHNASVLLLCRNVPKAESVAAALRAALPKSDGTLEVLHCDLASLASVRECAKAIELRHPTINVLINNAGQAGERGSVPNLTVDGFERTFQCNYLGHFLLTNLLLPQLSSGARESSLPSRVVNVSSLMHYFAWNFHPGNYNFEEGNYKHENAYGRSKLAQILFTRKLAKVVKANGVLSTALHPGLIRTNIHDHLPPYYRLPRQFLTQFCKTAFEGAATSLFLAVDPSLDGVTGAYFADCAPSRWLSAAAQNDDAADQLWEHSLQMVGLSQDNTASNGVSPDGDWQFVTDQPTPS